MKDFDDNHCFGYKKILKDDDGWIDIEIKPYKFDLLYLYTDKERIKPGWWTGSGWFGATLGKNEKVIKWKKKAEHSNSH